MATLEKLTLLPSPPEPLPILWLSMMFGGLE